MSMPQVPAGWWPPTPTPVGPGEWAARSEEFWVSFGRLDGGLVVRVRFERDTDGGASPTAVLVERADGRALSARAVRELPLAEVMSAGVGRSLVPWVGGAGRLVEPLHDGPARLPTEHHEQVLALLYEFPPAAWTFGQLRERWTQIHGEQVSKSTMRRWVVAALEHDRSGRERLAADRAAQQRAMDATGQPDGDCR